MSLLPPPERSAPPVISLLYVVSDAQQAGWMEQRLAVTLPGLHITRCDSLGSARTLLADGVDLVLVDEQLEDGTVHDLLHYAADQHLHLPILVQSTDASEAARRRLCQAGAFDLLPRTYLDSEHLVDSLRRAILGLHVGDGIQGLPPTVRLGVAPPSDGQQPADLLRTLFRQVADTTHAINNPLTIIAGNAQLLNELTRMMDVDPILVKPIQDIEEASMRLASTLQDLSRLKADLQEQLARLSGYGV